MKMNKRLLSMILVVVMVLGMIPFGAMAEEAETVTHIETCLENCALEDCACECHAEPETPAEPKQEENPVTPLSLDDTTTEETPVVDATKTEETPVCTCTPVEGVHAAECALSAKTEETPVVEDTKTEELAVHSEGCTEECTIEDCACECHVETLFDRLMACATLEELFAIVDETPGDELLALTEEENSQIESKIAQLEPEPLPPVVIEETSDMPVVSDIIYPTVNFDNVAPFGAPVEG